MPPIKPEALFQLAGHPVTNSVLTGFLIISALIVGIVFINLQGFSMFRPSRLQLFVEMIYELLASNIKEVMGKASINLISFLITFFVFILASNWFGLLPIVPSIGLLNTHATEEKVSSVHASEPDIVKDEHTDWSCIQKRNCILTFKGIKEGKIEHLFRPPTSDVSFTLMLAFISVLSINIAGVSALGLSYFSKFFDFSSAINFAVGILELISELSKLISFSFRLFGNVYAGEVLLSVMTSLTFGVATLPFLILELFVGAIQALVFFLLVTVFTSMARTPHHS